MPNPQDANGLIQIGKGSLHAARRALHTQLGDQAAGCLQEIGFAAGADMYRSFERWLADHTGVSEVADLDASQLGPVLSAYFAELGWGDLQIEQMGSAGLSITSEGWAEAEPGADAPYPSCFVTAGIMTEFLTQLAGGSAVSVMETECRSRGDDRCRFCAGSPETLEAAYEALASGGDFEAAFSR